MVRAYFQICGEGIQRSLLLLEWNKAAFKITSCQIGMNWHALRTTRYLKPTRKCLDIQCSFPRGLLSSKLEALNMVSSATQKATRTKHKQPKTAVWASRASLRALLRASFRASLAARCWEDSAGASGSLAEPASMRGSDDKERSQITAA